MAIYATNSGTQRDPVPVGNYIARCYQMIEIGTVREIILGKPKTLTKVRIGWELPTETREFRQGDGEKPLVISKEYTLSMNEKSNLRKDLKSWRGKDFTEEEAAKFDITVLLGKACMLNVIHNAKGYEEIAGITSLPKGMAAPAQVNKTFELNYDSFNQELFDSLPDFIKQKMQGSLEYAAMKQPHVTNMDANDITEPIDDLPF